MKHFFIGATLVALSFLDAMEDDIRSKLFPVVALSKETQALLDIIESRQWQNGNRAHIRLFGVLMAGSMGECRYKMKQYRLTADDYQHAAQEQVVLQAWLADLPPDVRDIQVTRFFEQMCFTNKIKTLQLLESWGLRPQALKLEFLSWLRNRALRQGYMELAVYLLNVKNQKFFYNRL